GDQGGGSAVRAGPAGAHPGRVAALRVAEDADPAEGAVGPGEDLPEERVEPLAVAGEFGVVVEAGVGVEGEGQVLGGGVRAQHEVLDRAGREVAEPGGTPAERHGPAEGHDVGGGAEDAGGAPPGAQVAPD